MKKISPFTVCRRIIFCGFFRQGFKIGRQFFFNRFVGDMNRINEKIDQLGGEMQWMKDALIEWAQAIDNDDKTNALIDKYCKEDQKRVEVRHFRT